MWCLLYCHPLSRLQNAPRIESRTFWVRARVVDVYDGDTFTVAFVQGCTILRRRCRCFGYDSPELRTKDRDEKAAAIAARDFLRQTLPTTVIPLQVVGYDKYGRWLVVWYHKGKTLADIMIEARHAVPYDGKRKLPFSTTQTLEAASSVN